MANFKVIGYDPPRTPEGCECRCHRGELTNGRCCMHKPLIASDEPVAEPEREGERQ